MRLSRGNRPIKLLVRGYGPYIDDRIHLAGGPATGRIDAGRDYQDRDPSEARRPFAKHGNRHECGRNRPEGVEGSRV